MKPHGPLTRALLSGERVFLPERTGDEFASHRQTLTRYGRILRTRHETRDGVRGVALWTEPRAA